MTQPKKKQAHAVIYAYGTPTPKIVKIKDCLYRYIRVPPLCQRFLNTWQFQRLRFIKQLGHCHYVYPSAVHTRFEHSLGVMHLAGLLADQLGVSDNWRDLVMVAGLLHDIGHVAFSHQMEEVLSKPHEQRSVEIVALINREHNIVDKDTESIITNMILGKSMPGDPPFLFEIVNNSHTDIDVDRMDYLQRDAYHTGMPGFQPDYLIKSAVIVGGHLAFRKKAEQDIEAMQQTRARMFKIVYRHPKVRQLNKLFVEALRQMNLSEDEALTYTDDEIVCRMRADPQMRRLVYRQCSDGDEVQE